jgi:hypothetical protein
MIKISLHGEHTFMSASDFKPDDSHGRVNGFNSNFVPLSACVGRLRAEGANLCIPGNWSSPNSWSSGQ